MFTRDFYSTCHHTAREFITPKIRGYDHEFFNRQSEIFPGHQNSLKCSVCEKGFSPLAQGYSQQEGFGLESSYSSVRPELLGTEESGPALTNQSSLNSGNSWNLLNPMRHDGNYQTFDFNTFASEPVGRLEECELPATNFASETQFYFQPQAEREFTSHLTSDSSEFSIESLLTKQSAVLDGESAKFMNVNQSCYFTGQNWPKVEEYKYYDIIDRIYSLDTNQRVSFDVIQTIIYNNFVTNDNNGRSLICQIDHKCPKVFNSLHDVENHIFSNFFFVYCAICQEKFNNPNIFRWHRKNCKKTSNELISKSSPMYTNSINSISSNDCASVDIHSLIPESSITMDTSSMDLVIDSSNSFDSSDGQSQSGTKCDFLIPDDEIVEDQRSDVNVNSTFVKKFNIAHEMNNQNNMIGERNHMRIDRKVLKQQSRIIFSPWNHQLYSHYTGVQVSADEIEAKIAENFFNNGSNERPYVCLVQHDCFRFFAHVDHIKTHLFDHFFYFECSACGKRSGCCIEIENHVRYCAKKVNMIRFFQGINGQYQGKI